MATDKQIEANRANAKRSTGPKTLAGKMRSSQNALRHGLSCALPSDSTVLQAADEIARALMGPHASAGESATARDLARVQLQLVNIRNIRQEMTIEIERDPFCSQRLRRLSSLDRYERYLRTKLRRLAHIFDSPQGTRIGFCQNEPNSLAIGRVVD